MGGRTGSRIAVVRITLVARAASRAAAAALALVALGCGARPHVAPAAMAGDQITLYRDRALVLQRIELVADRAGTITRALQLPAGVAASDVEIIDRGEAYAAELRIPASDPAPAGADAPASAPDEPSEDPIDVEADPPSRPPRPMPSRVALDVTAPRAGRFVVAIGYATDRLAWEAAYTMTTTAARDRAVLRGELAIRNTTGVVLRGRTRVVDDDLGAWRDRSAELLAGALTGAAPPSREPALRDLGARVLDDGETRIELAGGGGGGDAPRALRSVLVYDPIGTGLDHAGAVPVTDPSLGAEAVPTRVSESFEIDRDPRAIRGLPAGPVRLLERRADGSLELLGSARLFDPATRVARVDTVAIGTAQGVTGKRERRDWGKSDDQRRFSEEFLVTIDNARPRPIEVVLREHLYRGQNWTLAYQSAPAVKEGPQQIALRATVPARGRAKVLYVVVYTW